MNAQQNWPQENWPQENWPQENWDDIRFFLAVARHGSLSAAARVLGVNHTTVLRRIGALEAAVGTRLFERLPSGHVLTAAGDEMQAAALRIEENVAEAGRRLSGRDTQIRGTVRVTTIDILALYVLPRHVAAFKAVYPEIRVDLAVAEASLSLTKREADVAIRSTLKPPETLVGRAVSGLAFAVYGLGAYLDVAGLPVDRADDLAAHRWVGLDESFSHLRMAQWLERRVPMERVGYRVNSVAALFEAARAGMGLALLPCGLADTDPGLRRLTPPVDEAESRIWLLTHEDLRHMGRVRVFLDFMADALGRERGLLEGRRALASGASAVR